MSLNLCGCWLRFEFQSLVDTHLPLFNCIVADPGVVHWSRVWGLSFEVPVCCIGFARGAGKLSFAPTFRQIPQRVDVTRHSWPIKSCEAPSTRGHFAGGEMVQSAPVAVPQCARKGHHFEDDDDEGAFMPPHEFLSRTETKRDPHQVGF